MQKISILHVSSVCLWYQQFPVCSVCLDASVSVSVTRSWNPDALFRSGLDQSSSGCLSHRRECNPFFGVYASAALGGGLTGLRGSGHKNGFFFGMLGAATSSDPEAQAHP